MSSGDAIVLKVRLVDKKVFKKFNFFSKKSVRDARLHISKELEVDPDQYGLFLPPRDDQNGIWFRDDYPLDFYGLEGESDQKESMMFSSKAEAPTMEFVEFKKRFRPIKVAKGDNQFKTVMVDDTMNVADVINTIIPQITTSSYISETELFAMSEDEVEVLSGDMTIREQGYVGECTTGLFKSAKGDINLFVMVPFLEGWVLRKRGGNIMKGLKNWNKRWYTLKKNKLIYHRAKGFGPEMGCILMKTVQAVRPSKDLTDIPSKYHKSCFEIVTPARTFVMLANSANEMKMWVETLDFSRRMFAYETHFFGIAQKGSRLSMAIGAGSSSSSLDLFKDVDQEEFNKRREQEEKEKKQRMEEEEAQRREEQRLEEERLEKERIQREEEAAKQKALEDEEHRRQHEEFMEKQKQLELEKQRQLQEQIEEDRRLDLLMQAMEMQNEEREKLKEEQEKKEAERLEQAKKMEEEEELLRKEMERLEQERIEMEKLQQERVEQEARRKEEEERAAAERLREEEERKKEEERLEAMRIEEEERRLEQERLEEENLLEQIEKENQEEEERQLIAKRLKSMQARLDGVGAELPELKFLLQDATVSTPESLLISWANYITADCKLSKPLINLTAVEANLEKYTHLLHKLDPESFSLKALELESNVEKAELIVRELNEYGVQSITVEHLLSDNAETQLSALLTIYEEVGGNWQDEFQTQVVSKRLFATKYLTHILQNSPIADKLPQSPFEMIKAILDGQLLCQLINNIFPGTLDERVVQRNAEKQSTRSNLFIAINASRSLGAKHEAITVEKLQALNPSDLHNIVWEIVECCLLQAADPSKQRSLFHLMRAETRNNFRKLETEKIMLRWFNHHLRRICNRQINNFSDDVEDCENYAYLFEAIAPAISRKDEILNESDWEKRAQIVLEMATKLGCMPLLTPRDIVETENSKMNLLFVADIMRVCLALPVYKFGIDDQLHDQVEKSSEQSNNDEELLDWINQMKLGVEATSLLDSFNDGTLFLKVFDKVLPAGTVDPKKLKIQPNSVFKKLELFNYTMEICHKFKLNVAGIAGTDLLNGDIRSNRAILNQVRRYLGDKVTIGVVTAHQTAALKWANSKVNFETTKVKPIQSFKDQFLQDSLFFLELLEALHPNTVEKVNVQVGTILAEELLESNARYFLTLSWSVGYPFQVLWEDVVKVRSKCIKHIVETFQSTHTLLTVVSCSHSNSSSSISSDQQQQQQQSLALAPTTSSSSSDLSPSPSPALNNINVVLNNQP
ncbi:hypothetical protein SAMD00019534_061660 [Acytostelium subglobosum LB1]|uniref:hypothetical protein n=1 Tax=Acytostelium subglobosum LB1 TaxID=1410327 RepID=UPI0006447C59|nr:hypothetical protein SAMD00019534_061660 [Acytostelium subglobosum LB1]GAM22991.1 hypothetical protein SAMD00019534_061660 [Acytostelium subglobosum LB1]|eukprot:XP_012754218.1 hypothetical protein SAMD00019534_061660 [Acytostelium subglobosum LB1]